MNECLTNNGGCHNQAICANIIGSFTCTCKAGYSGDGFICDGKKKTFGPKKKENIYFLFSLLRIDIDECSTNYGGCHDQAICTNTPGHFTCTCKPGYSGDGKNCAGDFSCLIFFVLSYQHETNLDFFFFLAIKCPPISTGNAEFSTTLAGYSSLGKCDDSYYGSPTLYCDLTGNWNQTVTGNPCSSIFLTPSLLSLFFFP